MSITYELVCDETRQKLWIGQSSRFTREMEGDGCFIGLLYAAGSVEHGDALRRFLNATLGKPLRVVSDWDDSVTGYDDFEKKDR